MTNPLSGPMVSIVVPCRNERDHIEPALQSILSQEPPAGGFEVIVADGMSNDGTREILLRLANIDPRNETQVGGGSVDPIGSGRSKDNFILARQAPGIREADLAAVDRRSADRHRECAPPGPDPSRPPRSLMLLTMTELSELKLNLARLIVESCEKDLDPASLAADEPLFGSGTSHWPSEL